MHNHSCNTGAVYSGGGGGRKILALQGVPKVRYSNFKRYNFCVKRYFYMKFREDVYFSFEYMYSEFQELACLFIFAQSVAVAAWSQMIHFEVFYHLVRNSQFNPQTIFV